MTTAPARRRSRRVWLALGTILTILALAVVADRLAANYATGRIATAIEDDLGGVGVDVAIPGFPFLTQAIAGSIDDVTITATSLERDGYTIEDLVGTGRGVSLEGESIQTLSATATVTNQTMQTLITDALADTPDWALGEVEVMVREGNLELSARAIEVVDLAVDVQPITRGRSLSFELVNVRMGGATVTLSDIPLGLGDTIAREIAELEVELTMLPEGVTVSGLTVVEDGVLVTLTGTDVQIDQS